MSMGVEAVRRRRSSLALDLANTWDPYLDDPESLPDRVTLQRFLSSHGIEGTPGRDALRQCRAVRERLRTILAAPTPSELVARLNVLLGEVAEGIEIVRRRDGHWSLVPGQPARASLERRLAALAVRELTDLVTDVGPERIRQCRAAPCIEVFVDRSRNGRRVYCSRRCANRVNASRHRRRRSP
jgi:predicted RNA-binding Zn ribbon-like protein